MQLAGYGSKIIKRRTALWSSWETLPEISMKKKKTGGREHLSLLYEPE